MIHAALVVVALSVAAPPQPQTPEYGQSLAPAWGRAALCTTAATAYGLRVTGGGGAAAACFGWGTLLHLTADGGRFMACQVGTSTMSFDGTIASGSGSNITDANGPDGVGACMPLIASQSGDMVIKESVVSAAPGSRSEVGVCTKPVLTPGGDIGYPLCRVDGDCTDAGAASGTTCDTTLSDADKARIKKQGCAQVIYQCDTNSTKLSVRVDR